MSEPTTTPYHEAPASVTIRTYSAAGYDVMVTLRGTSGADVLPKLEQALTWLGEHGYEPTYPRRRDADPAPAGNGNGHTPAQPQPQAVPANALICPVHHTTMKARTANGETWHSHKATDPTSGATYWCRGGAG